MQVKMRIKGLKTNETSFKNAQNENQTEDTGQNLGYDSVQRSPFIVHSFLGVKRVKIGFSTKSHLPINTPRSSPCAGRMGK